MIYHLHNWSVVSSGDPFLPPEADSIRLHGRRDDDERNVVTSPVVEINGRNITTYSGSVYILEDINPKYEQWMKENGIEYDPENPIKDKR